MFLFGIPMERPTMSFDILLRDLCPSNEQPMLILWLLDQQMIQALFTQRIH